MSPFSDLSVIGLLKLSNGLTGRRATRGERRLRAHRGAQLRGRDQEGGYKISAREIEDLVGTHPTVRAVAVLGAPDRVWAERIVAAVVLRQTSGGDAIARDVTDLGAKTLADYKRPKEVRIFAELPRNALGKVQKHRILGKIREDS